MNNSQEILEKIIENVEKVIVGKRDVIELSIIALICNGHVLIEDVPGVGKTSLVSSLAKSLNASFKRIQFTPDVLPSDITGFSIYNQKTGEFEFKAGAIISQIVLADEINRTSPKTQASLLEVMEENQVTVDGVTYPLPKPFMVMATQNPVEYLGTYPLPEAELDRFFMKFSVGYPTSYEEERILKNFQKKSPLEDLEAVVDCNEILEIQEQVREVYVDSLIVSYIVSIVNETRKHPDLILGASPRGSLSLFKAAQGWAFYNGRDYVIPDDVIKMSIPVLSHRLIIKQEAKLRNVSPKEIIESIIQNKVRVPIIK
ncbi:MAG TPA: MoxR family ATPase [Defluviitaleaceae bacterium]|nr:MoxR family ATPase [Candidatus Epulonipiscium sp.]HOA81715.1 MoxR family ATPase [Defluviitaleaceae bacterium]